MWRMASERWGKFLSVAARQQASGDRFFLFEIPNERFVEENPAISEPIVFSRPSDARTLRTTSRRSILSMSIIMALMPDSPNKK